MGSINENVLAAAVGKLLKSRVGAGALGIGAGLAAAKLAGGNSASDDTADTDIGSDKDTDKSIGGMKVMPMPADYVPDRYDIKDAPAPLKPGEEPPRTVPPHLPGGSPHDPEVLQFNSGGKWFRVARDWKDGTPLPNEDGEYKSSLMKQPQSMDIMRIEADQQWAASDPQKIFINYDGKQIRSNYSQIQTWPTDPKHPFYHRIFAMGYTSLGQRQDPYRGAITSLLRKDSKGYTSREYTESKECPVAWGTPPGFTRGGNSSKVFNSALPLAQYGHNMMDGWQSPGGGTLIITWTPTRAHIDQIKDALAAAMDDTSEEIRKGIADQYKSKVSKLQPISFNSPMGRFMGQTWLLNSNKRVANAMSFVPNQGPNGPHVDQIMVWYYGPIDAWERAGYIGMSQFISTLGFRQGIGPLGRRSTNEELNRIIDLVRK